CRLLTEELGSTLEPTHGPAKAGEQRRSCLETGLARRVLGWTPRTALRDGLRQTVAYYRDHGRV
ncbi:MAG TPA: UDP-glucose 4-epimerase, partial [Candidatus Eisenbacteria bacterium]|nr:UDP-glucose 4-epimerase [Candidatus Eisenbacteria bacterium]